jgi:hypothetical protein
MQSSRQNSNLNSHFLVNCYNLKVQYQHLWLLICILRKEQLLYSIVQICLLHVLVESLRP